ncbi:MAG TPA: tRNA epoxyqueuosine(34) reductase QueG [Pyrinomonadaceae bacterium]|nr:tRNA epoxyqueuosine(34) reductase QueG [Pyrinomonadaceae bacterium]
MPLLTREDSIGPIPIGSLSAEIKKRARIAGFDLVGIARAEPLPEQRRQLNQWLARGYHGEMHWLARDPDRRSDPREIFPPARSVVVVALNYYTPEQHAERVETGKVSRYAWGDDYHLIVTSKLQSLLLWIKQLLPAAEGKVCVDTQPIMDKAWAERAGLGWIGKHTNLITKEFGSWVFLGELLLNLELEYDGDTVEDHCGTCTLCIEACPTEAICEPYVLDSNKCISYATIELRTPEFPAEIAHNLDGWFYGCDICQDVCPWNRFAQISNEVGFAPRPGNVDVNLAEILELSPETYAERFRHSAMKRAKLSGLQRNARSLREQRAKSKGQGAKGEVL